MAIKSITQTYGLLSKGGQLARINHNDLQGRLANNSHFQFLDGNTKIFNAYNVSTAFQFVCRNDDDGTEIGINSITAQDLTHIEFQLAKTPTTTCSIFYKPDLAYKWKNVVSVGQQATINAVNQEIIVANNTQYNDRNVSNIYTDYLTALTTDFVITGWNTGNSYTIDSFTSQTATDIVIKLTTIPAENITVRLASDLSIAWWNLTPNIDEITINRRVQSIHGNPDTVEVNSAVNVALDRIFKSSVDVIGMFNEDTTDINYATNYLLTDNETIKSALEKFDVNITNKYKIVKNVTGGTLSQYKVVKVTGVNATYDATTIDVISAITDTPYGIVISDILDTEQVKILQEGILRIDNFNTSGASIGDTVYCDGTGNLTLTTTAIEVGKVLTLDLSGYVLFTIGSGSGGLGSRQYTNEYLLADNETITDSLDKLDSALNYKYVIGYNGTGSQINALTVVKVNGENANRLSVTPITTVNDEILGIVESNIADTTYGRIIQNGIITSGLDTTGSAIGDKIYITGTGTLTLTETPLIIGEIVSLEVNGKINVNIYNYLYDEFYTEEFPVDAFQDITKSAGVSIYTITADEDCTTPVPITDGTKILNDLRYISITDTTGKLIYKQGSLLPVASNVVKVTNYNPATREITLNFEPKTDFRVGFKAIYNRKNIPDGKILNAGTYVNVINSESTNTADEIEYNNSTSLLESTDLQNAVDELTNLTKYNSFGVEVLPTLTKEIDGTVTIGNDGTMVFNTLANGTGLMKRFANITGGNLSPTNNAVNYLYVDYNGGTPVYAFTLSPSTFLTNATYTPVCRIVREGTTLHFEEYDQYAVQLSNKLLYKDISLNSFERQNGLTLSTEVTRIVTVSAGTAWFGVQFWTLDENKSGTSGNMYEYYLVAGVWAKSGNLTSYDSSYYSDGTNRLSLNNNKYVSKYFYRDIGSDNEIYYIHGNEYNSLAESLAEAVPVAPTIMTTHSAYVGKIVIQKGATNGTAYSRTWGTSLQSASVQNHNDLANRDSAGNHSSFIPLADSTTAYQFFKADGTTPVLTIDSTTGNIGFGATPDVEFLLKKTGASYRVNIDSDVGQVSRLRYGIANVSDSSNTWYAGRHSDDLFKIVYATGTASNNGLVISKTGQLSIGSGILKPISDSTTAFQITKADGTTNLFTFDTVDGRFGIGTTEPGHMLEVYSASGKTKLGITSTGEAQAGIIRTKRLNGTSASPTEVLSGEFIGRYLFLGQNNDGNGTVCAEMRAVAEADFGAVTNAPAALAFLTSDTTTIAEKMRITSTGNVGIGSSNPSRLLSLNKTGINENAPSIYIKGNSAQASQSSGYLQFFANAGSDENTLSTTADNTIFGQITGGGVNSSNATAISTRIRFEQDGAAGVTYLPSRITFYTGTSTATGTERMRIGNDGKVYMNNLTGTTGGSDLRYNTSTKEVFYDTSALKYKENIKEATATERIYQLNVVNYDRKDGSVLNETGLIADEVKEIIPELVCCNELGEVESYNKSDLVPFLLKEIQKLNARVIELESQ